MDEAEKYSIGPFQVSARAVALAALVLGAVNIGLSPIFVRLADVGPVSSAFWRLALAAPLLLVWVRLGAARRRRAAGAHPLPPAAPARPRMLLLCGVFFAADLGLWHWSITLTTVANATLLANLNAVFVTLGGFLLFGERVRGLFIIGLVLAFAGAAALMGASLEFAPQRLTGDLLGVATAVMYASYILSAKALRRRYSAAEVTLYIATVTAAILLPIAIASGEQVLPASAAGWLPLAGLAVICQIMGQGFIIHALAHLPAAFSALTLLIQPVVAALVAWLLFAEALGALELAGAALVLAGIFLARFGSRQG